MSSVRNSQAELDDLIHDLEAEDKRGSVASVQFRLASLTKKDSSLSLYSHEPCRTALA